MKYICEKITCCQDCPYYISPNGTFVRCNHIDGPTRKMTNLEIYREIPVDCPLNDIEVK
jgi:hypothetical protein